MLPLLAHFCIHLNYFNKDYLWMNHVPVCCCGGIQYEWVSLLSLWCVHAELIQETGGSRGSTVYSLHRPIINTSNIRIYDHSSRPKVRPKLWMSGTNMKDVTTSHRWFKGSSIYLTLICTVLTSFLLPKLTGTKFYSKHISRMLKTQDSEEGKQMKLSSYSMTYKNRFFDRDRQKYNSPRQNECG